MRHKKRRITDWHYDNPAEVERAFRQGFLTGIQLGAKGSADDVFIKYERTMKLRHLQHWGNRWSDVRAARLRGISHGLWYLHECHRYDGDVTNWAAKVQAWAKAELSETGLRGGRANAMPPEPVAGSKRPGTSLESAQKVDVPALFRRIAAAADIPEEQVFRQGAWLVNRSWRLHVWLDREFRYCGHRRWIPGIAVNGCDPEGRFGQYDYFTFNEFTTAQIDMPRVDAFLETFSRVRRKAKEKWAAKRSKRRRRTTSAETQETATPA